MKKTILISLLALSSSLYADCVLKVNYVNFGSMIAVRTATTCMDGKTFIISSGGGIQQVLKEGFHSMEPVICDCINRENTER